MATAAVVAEHGAVGLRGGVFKPRTSPHSFQGLQWDGLDLLAEARERTGLPSSPRSSTRSTSSA